MLKNNVLNTKNKLNDLKLEINMIQDYDINFRLEDEYKYSVSDEGCVYSKETDIATISGEAFVRALNENMFIASYQVQIGEMENILFHAYILNSLEETKATEYAKLVSQVLHENEYYFLSESVALELVKYHKEHSFDIKSIIEDDKTINKSFFGFATRALNSVLESIKSALLGLSNDSIDEPFNGALYIKPSISMQGEAHAYEEITEEDDLTGEAVNVGTSFWFHGNFHTNLILDLAKLYDIIGAKDFNEAVLQLLTSLNHITPKIRIKDEVRTLGLHYMHVAVREGLPVEIDLNDAIQSCSLGSTEIFVKTVRKLIQDSEIKLGDSTRKQAEFELDGYSDQSLNSFYDEIMQKINLLTISSYTTPK